MDSTAASTVYESSVESNPTCLKPHSRTTSSFELPDMVRSADTIMEENRGLWMLSSAGKLEICFV